VPGVLAYVVAIALALVIVPLTHGRFDRLAQIRFARPWLFFVGVGIQIALELVPIPRARFDDLGLALLLASYVALLAFCVSNLRMRGMELIALGIALNALVIALNMGMPYRVADGLPRQTTVKHRPIRSGDVATVLADRITIGAPFHAAMSVGDIVLSIGIVELAYAGSRRRRRVDRTRPRANPPFEMTGEHPVIDLTTTGEIDLREPRGPAAPQTPAPTGTPTTRSSASRTRGS
jgi:hypothetical protein